MKNKILTAVGLWISLTISITFNSGCAQLGAPTGGPKDTLAPVLIRANPALKSLHFRGNKITLTFNEYVEVQEAQNNVLVSPLQKNSPNISNNLKTITIKLKDSLLPNTTYSIQFGKAIKDINEGNILNNFTYVFSTGNTIDSLSVDGKVILAETGLVDSTISVLLYRNTNDTAVQKTKPDYLARLKGDGSFHFNNLPPGNFKIYALKDGDGNKNYSLKTELFAFLDNDINIPSENADITLYAFEEEKPKDNKVIKVLKPVLEKKLKYSSNFVGTQDLLTNLELRFNNPLKVLDINALALTDTNYQKIPGGQPEIDSTRKIISYSPVWKPGEAYRLILSPATIEDSAGNHLAKADTFSFSAKNETDYGRVLLRFKNYDQTKNPVLQLVNSQTVKFTFPLTSAEWTNKRIPQGEYEIRILFDNNKDGLWTPGNYNKKLQPEKAITLPQKLSIKADWDNERDVELK
jgi:hypothetical protein